MKVFKVSLIAGALLLLIGCSASMQVQSGWYRGYVKIDGKLDDWDGLWQLPEGGKMAMAAKNDGENLFLAVKTRDMLIIRKIATQGFEIMIDRKGGHVSRYGLVNRGTLMAPTANVNSKTAAQEDVFLSSLNSALTGPVKLSSVDQNDEIQPFPFRGSAISLYGDNEWFCEFKIPLTALKELPKPGSIIGVGFKTALAPRDPTAFPDPRAVKQELVTNEWWVKVRLATPPE